MKPNPIHQQQEHPFGNPRADWYDDAHDTVLILAGRDYEENGSSPRHDFSSVVA